jgi:iron uptake system component EfeO
MPASNPGPVPFAGVALAATVLVLGLTGCGDGGDDDGTGQDVSVNASDDACTLSTTSVRAGATTFAIKNSGGQVTEVYVYAPGDKIVSEKENIGPGTSYDLTVHLDPGTYEIACKPGMVGDGIRQTITVTGATATVDAATAGAVADYRAWVQQQVDEALPVVTEFVAAVKAGNVEQAKSLYAKSRVGWESIEPVAEAFGDLDPRMDIREADLEADQEFTGWHRLEKALWTGEDLAPLGPVADQLLADFKELQSRVPTAQMSLTSIGNGAKELLDEVASGKITGEEEAFSHTDLVDFAANVAGAEKAYEVLRPIVIKSTPGLVEDLDNAFAAMAAALAPYRDGDSYVSYDTVTEDQLRQLAQVVDALGEPLSQLTAAAVAS